MATLCVSSIVHGAMPAGHVCSAVSSGQQKLHARARLSSTSSLYFGSSNLALRSESKGVKQVATVETRCESKTEETRGPSADIWIGRLAMVGFAAAITSEIVTGKGVLATAGLSTPQPTLALALAALVGGLTAFGVFRSAGSD
ncbi:hypothetical protein MPTK1_3g06770 [Marchantia polymorpha subsp. ruderalis]|uniref:Uncharacterized protein n=2 Tax=Marchantia polymorpha TaxID=3197 RepID=A0A176W670_MARPO|nr:hypothetical protein AXG93_2515s1110 [Marchantia polymorpha subsp. ruderalis]PTQ48116.1 hypothetical protein MARPO_0006s0145 [Marchantia polymorpha]BBN04677.1 hypothetical protein Mp_3g06770 [Marchantia polymorpha subsp. ruderalis]|eukprot:PTQ48116.1 hypothetical protein MARPO_0006s0145 [Marchantia polymorpha]